MSAQWPKAMALAAVITAVVWIAAGTLTGTVLAEETKAPAAITPVAPVISDVKTCGEAASLTKTCAKRCTPEEMTACKAAKTCEKKCTRDEIAACEINKATCDKLAAAKASGACSKAKASATCSMTAKSKTAKASGGCCKSEDAKKTVAPQAAKATCDKTAAQPQCTRTAAAKVATGCCKTKVAKPVCTRNLSATNSQTANSATAADANVKTN